MLAFITGNLANIIVLAILIAYTVFVIRWFIKEKKAGRSITCGSCPSGGCSGGCSGHCDGCNSCR